MGLAGAMGFPRHYRRPAVLLLQSLCRVRVIARRNRIPTSSSALSLNVLQNPLDLNRGARC